MVKPANPYVGPRPFEEGDRLNFFGRDEEAYQLAALVVAHRAVLLYAQSGAGKSSLLRARVLPGLRESHDIQVLFAGGIGGDPATEGSPAAAANIYISNVLLGLYAANPLPLDPARMDAGAPPAPADVTLSQGLLPYLGPEAGDGHPALLVLDQFEEIFSSHPERYEDRAEFFRQLQACLAQHTELSLLIAMREDYLADLDAYAALLPDRLRTRYRLERLGRDGALAAVREPAAGAGLPFAPGVAEGLVDDLRRAQPRRTPASQAAGPAPPVSLGSYVEPVHLQIVCQQLWDNLPPERTAILAEDLQAAGNVDDALIGFYERALARTAQETGAGERQLRAWFEEHLITSVRTRGLVFRGENETAGLPNAAVDVLVNAYIVRAVVRGSDTWYELAHDRLVEPILASNQTWRVRTRPPRIVRFEVQPRVLIRGQQASLRWQTEDADAVTVGPIGQAEPPNGELTLMPEQTTVYTVTATRAGAAPVSGEPQQVLVVSVQREVPAGVNPYVGPRSFTPEDRPLFFGRDREAAELLLLVMTEPVTLFYADSGAGKSSLLAARLMGDLSQQGFDVLPVGRVGLDLPASEPVENVYVASLLASIDPGGDIAPPVSQSLPGYLRAYRDRRAGQGVPPDTPLALVIDQAEELFTTHPERLDHVEFLRQVADALKQDPHLHVLLSFRSEYLADFDQYATLFAAGFPARCRVQRLSPDAALDAVKNPAELAGRSFAPGAAEALVDDLRQLRTTTGHGEIISLLGAFAEPLQLQVLCRTLWDRLPPDRSLITPEDVRASGDADQAFAGAYEAAVAAAGRQQTGVDERRVRAWIERQLITEARTRGLVYMGETETAGLPNGPVRVLADAQLLRAVMHAGGIWYELAHDRLIEPILADNAAWREAHTSRLAVSVEAWEAFDRDPRRLLRGAELAQAEAQHLGPLTEAEAAFIQASRAAEREERRRRLRVRAAALAMLVVAVGALAVFIWSQWSITRAQATAARNERDAQVAAAAVARVAQATAEADRNTAVAAESTAQAANTAQVKAYRTLEANLVANLTAQAALAVLPLVPVTATSTPTPARSATPTVAGPTPTAAGTPAATPTPFPVASRPIKPLLLPTANPIVIAQQTQLADVRAAQTALAVRPTETKAPAYAPMPDFAPLWQGNARLLGRPLDAGITVSPACVQEFQGGRLFWRSDDGRIYMVFDRDKQTGAELPDGDWFVGPGEWGLPPNTTPEGAGASPPGGLYEPKGGLGWVWGRFLGGYNGRLGWATTPELCANVVVTVQRFENGRAFKTSLSPKTYALLDSPCRPSDYPNKPGLCTFLAQ